MSRAGAARHFEVHALPKRKGLTLALMLGLSLLLLTAAVLDPSAPAVARLAVALMGGAGLCGGVRSVARAMQRVHVVEQPWDRGVRRHVVHT